jgi:dienelactone hydrolase
MGSIILAIAVIAEVAFAAYCIVTKSSHRRVRNWERVGAFAAFLLLALLTVIQWSFRWYGLALLLVIWAALGAWALVRRKPEESSYRTGGMVRRGILTLLRIWLVLAPALVFPQHKQPAVTGSHPVATASYSYTDPSRVETFSKTGGNREVNLECWYPSDATGKYPLVIFSHGTGGVKTSNTSTFLNLASNGYVVCSIDHPYHSLFSIDAAGKRTTIDPSYLQEYMNVSRGMYDGATVYQLEQKWLDLRTADINFILDMLLTKAAAPGSDPVYQLIDGGKIGLIGHSLGGAAAAEVARRRNDIGAVVNLDADLLGDYVGYVDGKEVMTQAIYPVPLLTILADDLAGPIDAIPNAKDVVALRHVEATAPNTFDVHLTGTDHMSLTDLPLSSPFLSSLISAAVPRAGSLEADPLGTVNKMNELILRFFNAYLKGQGSFDAAGTD